MNSFSSMVLLIWSHTSWLITLGYCLYCGDCLTTPPPMVVVVQPWYPWLLLPPAGRADRLPLVVSKSFEFKLTVRIWYYIPFWQPSSMNLISMQSRVGVRIERVPSPLGGWHKTKQVDGEALHWSDNGYTVCYCYCVLVSLEVRGGHLVSASLSQVC